MSATNENPEVIEIQKRKADSPATIGSARSSYPQPYRLTVVIEYPNVDSAPAIGKQKCLDGEIVALQFSDALTENEVMRAALQEISKPAWAFDVAAKIARKALEVPNVKVSDGGGL